MMSAPEMIVEYANRDGIHPVQREREQQARGDHRHPRERDAREHGRERFAAPGVVYAEGREDEQGEHRVEGDQEPFGVAEIRRRGETHRMRDQPARDDETNIEATGGPI
jgi:hypothetical protein